MKRLTLVLIFAVAIALSTTPVFAQPFSPNIAGDTYGTAQGGGNLAGVVTPRDNNDNLGPYAGAPFTLGGGPNPADINDAINLLLGTSYARNSDVDFLQHTAGDNTWKDIAGYTGNTGVYTLISLTAANMNTLSVYDVTAPATKIPVLGPSSGFGFTGDGSAAKPFAAGLSPFTAGTNFGFSLTSVNSVTHTFDSDPSVNADGLDHMLTYHLAALAGETVYIDLGAGPVEYTFKNPYLIVWEDKPCVPNAQGVIHCGDEDYDDMVFLVDGVLPNTPEPATMALLGSGLFGMAGIRRKKRS